MTGQCSHVYSPGNSVFYAWKTIMAQWRIAYAIAEQNIARGIKPMPPMEFLRHWRAAADRQNKVRECINGSESKVEKAPAHRNASSIAENASAFVAD